MEEHILSEKLRNVLFHAQYYSSPCAPCPIKPEHLLLALLATDPDLFRKLSGIATNDVIDTLRDDLQTFDPPERKPWLATEPPPLSVAAKHVLRLATESSNSLDHSYVGTEHLLLGLLKHQVPDS